MRPNRPNIIGFTNIEDIFEQRHYVMAGVGGDVFCMGPFETAQLCLENIKRMLASDNEPDGFDMLDAISYIGVGKFSGLDIARYGMNLVSGDVFAEKLPWEEK